MKVKILVDSTITVASGTIVDISEKQFKILRSLNRAEAYEEETKKERAIVEERETRKQPKRKAKK